MNGIEEKATVILEELLTILRQDETALPQKVSNRVILAAR